MKLKAIPTRIITNPFNIYAISFIAVLCSFSLKWSSYYDTLGVPLLIFILITSFISLLLGALPIIKRKNSFRPIPVSRHNPLIWRLLVVGYALEFIYCRSIPFIDVVIGGIGQYSDFEGIPMFHVLIFYINSFWGIYVFLQYQSNLKEKKLKWYIFLSYIPLILLLNRGAIVHLLFSSVFIYLMRIGGLSIKKIIYFILGTLTFLLLFGIVGNARDSQSQTDETYILRIGGAKPEFIDSYIPKPLFWGYLYTATPIGNIQNAIDYAKPDMTWDNFTTMLMESCCPDFVSKRLLKTVPEDQLFDYEPYLVLSTLNAPAVYYQPYIRFGWVGMIWMFVFMIIIVFLYTYFISSRSVFFLVGWGSLLSTIALNTFNNMWFAGGLALIIMVFIAVFFEQLNNKLHHAEK